MSFLNIQKRKKEAPPLAQKSVPDKAVIKKLAVAEGKVSKVAKSVRPHILRRPHITEKASAGALRGVYAFEVATDANKHEIAEAVSLFYKVTPLKVTVVTIPAKRITVKGRTGFRKGGKKAYVYLKKGEKIELI